ncbi:MAG: zf-HC2 domain-containing protein [Holophagales bacterium]|nr:zf-HC2 domain-containing protein [Holophagales bacterium]
MSSDRCEEFEGAIVAELSGSLDAGEREALRAHVAACPRCAAEAESLGRIWRGLEPEADEGPSPFLAARFERMLAREIEAREPAAPARPSAATLGAPPLRRWAVAAAMLVVGLGLGWALAGGGRGDELAALRTEVGSLRETMAVALLSERSPSERLRAVSYGRDLAGRDPRVADALLAALANDPDVNVRLAALSALVPNVRLPEERQRLVRTVSKQDSPLVQLSAIDLLLESGGEAAHRDLEKLAANPELDPTVASYLRSRLGRRI